MLGGELTVTEGLLGVACHTQVEITPKRQAAATRSTQEAAEAQERKQERWSGPQRILVLMLLDSDSRPSSSLVTLPVFPKFTCG